MLRVAVLVSGRGSNLRSLIDARRAGKLDAEIALVVSNKPDAPALSVAREAGIRAVAIDSAGRSREAHEDELAREIDASGAQLVALAGYMRVLTPGFIRRFRGRLVNIHPSLLPAFPGLDAQGQAHARGVRIAGCTTHFVTEDVDAGPIILQAAVAIPPGASANDVRERILGAEHRLYPATLQLIAQGRIRLAGDRVEIDGASAPAAMLLSPEAT